ncbi:MULTISPECIES: hypothetical protein [unclassified Bradyrhizobium]|jgi:hypothetical protein|uniref:hypothetical protein n=1 Tax=unclassified Bradyrhizobium TaxID=2631580 RepID=UPI00104A9943|nr:MULTISPECIES: hypothetical protein [unclassified Bradyrhizobium]
MHFTFDVSRNAGVADTIPVRLVDGSLRRLVPVPAEHALTFFAYPLLLDGWPAHLTQSMPPPLWRSQITETSNVPPQEAAAALCLRPARSHRYPQS